MMSGQEKIKLKCASVALSFLITQGCVVKSFSDAAPAFIIELSLSRSAQELLIAKNEKIKIWIGYTSQKATKNKSEPGDLGHQEFEVLPTLSPVSVPEYKTQSISKESFATVELNISSGHVSSKANLLRCIDAGPYIDISNKSVKVECCLIKGDPDLKLDKNKKEICKPARAPSSQKNHVITKNQFEKVATQIEQLYKPVAEKYKAQLRIEKKWDDPRPEAHAGKKGNDWFVYLAGGLARKADMTIDGLTFVLCHELGHQVAGYPFVNLPGNEWNTKEGQTDYYAAFVCARTLWKDQINENINAGLAVDPYAKLKCDEAWKTADDRSLCYRITIAGQVAINNEAGIYNLESAKFSSPESKKTMNLQCRLDSVLQGALCAAPYDFYFIPGYHHIDGINSQGAKEQAQAASCDETHGYRIGLKPRCWWP